jgi:N,N'-diacetylbacillosaminyl-diphospho-undecaprenol alpha-1,3-N-acetylgalactosaminyltransferase
LLVTIWRVIRNEQPDVVHCFTHKAAIFGAIASKVAGVGRVVVTVTGLGSAFVGGGLRGRLLQLMLKVQYRIATRFVHAVFFQNPDDLREMTGWAVPPSKARLTAGSGLDLSALPKRSQQERSNARLALLKELPSIPAASTIVLFPARATVEKGLMDFYLAVKLLVKRTPGRFAFLHVGLIDDTGKGALSLKEVVALAKDCGVHYLGFKEDIERYLLGADIIALPSHREGLPRSLVEALALGKVVVASDAPGCKETVVHGKNGFLCATGDPDSLAACIQMVTPELINSAVEVSRGLAECKFDAQKVVQATLHEYGLEETADAVPVL